MNLDLVRLGWDEKFQACFDAVDDGRLIPARVMRENRGQYIVDTGEAEHVARMPGVIPKRLKDASNTPTVGDWITAERLTLSDHLVIVSILPRKSLFERQRTGNESKNQSVAANFDHLFLVSGLDEEFNPHRIQRYLSLVRNNRAEAVILLNKADLIGGMDEVLEEVIAEVRRVAGDIPIHPVSAKTPESLNCLDAYLGKGQTVAMLGSSGVGKSSLANALVGEELLATREVRDVDSRGRHTTTWREIVELPNGALLIDLPGMRELGVTGEDTGMKRVFTDIEVLARQCKFRNCGHSGEPGCAIEQAIDRGDLDPERFEQYVKLQEENAKVKQRQSAREKSLSGQKVEPKKSKEVFFKDIAIRKKKEAKLKRKREGEWEK